MLQDKNHLLTDMNNTDKNSPSTDERTDRAMQIAMRKLSELDARHPDLGIGERMRAALQNPNPASEISLVLEEFRDQVAA